jgi:hypothetical protein
MENVMQTPWYRRNWTIRFSVHTHATLCLSVPFTWGLASWLLEEGFLVAHVGPFILEHALTGAA